MPQRYVMQKKPKKELIVCEQFCNRKIKSYDPKIGVKVLSPRVHKLKPYFPGYLFIHIDIGRLEQSIRQREPGSIG